ncbi:MAG: glutamyl-tRNA synthetase [Patescibacteria group bacterium]|nr:glutamyl-tRNA synthetase [Patescibacteria group bacterium]
MNDNKKKESGVRLRFAPSPTGFLHIGNLRSALFGYFIAKSLGGKFILRLEDTDQKREVAGALEKLLAIFSWLDIDFAEGPHKGGDYGPYIQTERLEIYHKYAKELVVNGGAYRCFCTSKRLEEMRAEQQAKKLPPRYDRCCRDLSTAEIEKKIKNGEEFVIRQKMPLSGEVIVSDELRGEIKFSAKDLDDHVLIKSNGVPTYQFASVIDDHLMAITHVTRGDEWLPSFPKNILLYQAFGWQAPKFVHLPLILNKTGGKLSKRQGDVYVEDYKQKGYLSEAIINFCILLGWHPKNDQEILSRQEIIANFKLEEIGVSPAIFDEEKLDYLNGYYIRKKTKTELMDLLRPYFIAEKIKIDDKQLEKITVLAQERIKKLADIIDFSAFIFKLPDYDGELLAWKKLSKEEAQTNLQLLLKLIEKIPDKQWEIKELETLIFAFITENNGKNGDFLWPLRVALSGLKNSPGPFEIAWALGKEETINRIKSALNK